MSTFPNEFHSAKNLLTSVETEFIKNLQQQIYYLELEANFLRAQTKKSFILQPKVELEAERMLHKLQEMRSQVDGLHIELKRKEANLYMLQTEKERLGKQLKLSDDLHLKEKQSLVEEIVQLKRMKEIMDTEFSHKEMEFLQSKQELERQLANLKSNEHKVTIIKQQIEQRSEQEKMIETQLGENSLELLKVQSAHHEMEEKYYSMTATMQNKITHDFRDEIRQLHQQLREKEVMREQDRFLRSKMADDCAAINKENVMLHSQTLELNKQLERERMLKEETDFCRTSSAVQLITVKGREEQLRYEVKRHKELLETEKRKFKQLMEKILLLEQGKTSVELNEATVRSRVAETENRFANGKEENLQLKRDKTLLVDLITDLQNQLSNKEEELSRIYSEIQLFDQDITTLKSQNALQQSLHFEKWQELSGVSSSMMELTGPMKRCIKTKAD
ncbi:A-kinase anchor protein 9-like isoform X3 [Scyliorhinus canicula]|uniref:A-kinase anchor protein 9-like isoform X3 n=1 Tax=Scyliorhinus canicula TaxID=7830 RepID=UPI0018F5BADA|nr:A-kinase anchor protein 9-like isoform X3 [Scyliorhinus canicula]